MLDKKTKPSRPQSAAGHSGRRTRADRALETRRRLIDAAAKVVGAEGYANASVAKITALAEIAQGTFYNYFATQQDLFDQLLPELGGEVLEFIHQRLAGETDSLRREEIGFRAYFDFLAERPEFYRILNEAETFAPKAFHDHMRNMAAGYMRALSRSHAKGEMPGFDPRELEVIVYTLLAARNYLSYRYTIQSGHAGRLPSWVEQAYMKFVRGGVLYGGTEPGPNRRRRRSIAPDAASHDQRLADAQLVTDASGATSLTVNLTEADRDEAGAVRRNVLLDVIERVASSAAAEGSAGPLKLESLSVGFPAVAASDTLVTLATAVQGPGTVHVSVAIHDLSRDGPTIAAGQAVYSIGERG